MINFRNIQRIASAAASFGSSLAVNDRLDTVFAKIQSLFVYRYTETVLSAAVSGGASSTADIKIASLSIAAANLQIGHTVKVTVRGTINKPLSGGTTVNLWLKVDGTTKVATITWTPAAAVTTRPFEVEFNLVIRTLGASGTLFAGGGGRWMQTATTNITMVAAGSAMTRDMETTLALSVGFNFSNSNASNLLTADYARIGMGG